jgi:hypothetical protein
MGKAEAFPVRNKSVTNVGAAIAVLAGMAGSSPVVPREGLRADNPPKDISAGVAIRQEGLASLQAKLVKRIMSTPARVMKNSGLAGAMGGARVKVSSSRPQEVVLPIPQLADGQVPVCYFISTSPADAAIEFRLRKREGGNLVVAVRLAGKKQDVRVAWSSVVLLSPRDVTPNCAPAKPYRAATACAQSRAKEVVELATATWPRTGKAAAFAANIQRHIREIKRVERPRSLDAVGIIKSGENSICTANANLASALMRSKGIACRSVAVIPPNSQRLEMHRIVEFSENGRWVPFDPSSLQADIPAKPWQNIIMAKTTTPDEQVAMKPRRGAMLGCPYGQEAELLTSGVNLFGLDFFWTMAKPLAEFEPTEEASRLLAAAWARYLKTGTLTQDQLKAASAKTAAELVELLKNK